MAFFKKQVDAVREFRKSMVADDRFYIKLLGSSAVGALVLLVLAGAFFGAAWLEKRRDLAQNSTLGVVRAASELEMSFAEMESLHRAAVLTENASYRDPFERRVSLAKVRIEDLKHLVSDDAAASVQVQKVESNMNTWVTTLALPQLTPPEAPRATVSGVTSGTSRGRVRGTSTTQTPAQMQAQTGASQALPKQTPAEATLLHEAGKILQTIQADALVRLAKKMQDTHFAQNSYLALMSVPRLKNVVSDMERAQWGWLLTGKSNFADLNKNAVYYFNTYYGHISVLVADIPQQITKLGEIRSRVDLWQREIAGPEFSSRPDESTVAALLTTSRSRGIMEDLRTLISDFEREQGMIYDRSQARIDFNRKLKTAILSGLCGIGLVLLVASGWYSFSSYRRHIRKTKAVESQTRSIIDSSMDGIITFNEQGSIVSVNPAAETMFGFRALDIVGKSLNRVFPQLRISDLTGKARTTINATATRQGMVSFPVEMAISQMDAESPRRYVALVRDVSERRRSEETLRQIGMGISAATGEEFLRSLLKQVSKALQTDYSFVVEIVRGGQQVTSSLTLCEHGQVRAVPKFAIAGGFCEEILRRGAVAHVQDVVKQYPNDQLLRDLSAQSLVATPLVDHRGKAVGVMGVLHKSDFQRTELAESTLHIFAARAAAEIERKRFAEDLAAEKERLAITLRAIGDGFIATDVDGRILLMNAVAEKLTGWAFDQANGKPLMEVFRLYNERTRTFAENAVQRIIETGSAVGVASSSMIVAKEGQQRTIETTASPIRDKANRKIGVVLVFKDVTEKLRLEDEHRKAEKLESLGVAAGGIAHDFNNLLTAIIGNLSLALMDIDPDEEVADRITTAKKASLRAQDLAQQLLTFAKGGAPIKKTASIGQMIQDTVKFSLRGSNIRSEFHVPKDLWPCEIDAGQISQVITNLTVNAEQAMPAGGTIRITCANFDADSNSLGGQPLRPGRYVRIAVQDEGIGIPEDYLTKIFDPYFTTKPKGSGLGLATAYSIIKNHDGIITVESTPGEGTTFFLYLAASDKAAPPTIEERIAVTPRSATVSRVGRGRVLVLDDEEVICALVSAALQPLGYEVKEAYDAATAIRMYEEALRAGKKFDAVITDLTIPGGMGGLEAVKILREMDPEVKAIVSSGYATDPVMSRHREYGFTGCIAKPYEVAALGKVVDEVIAAQGQPEVYHDFVQAQLA